MTFPPESSKVIANKSWNMAKNFESLSLTGVVEATEGWLVEGPPPTPPRVLIFLKKSIIADSGDFR